MSISFFGDSRVEFAFAGPPVLREEIAAVIPKAFRGKTAFIEFYLRHNGGRLKGLVYRNRRAADPDTRMDRVQIESFFFIPRTPDETSRGLRSVVAVLKQRSSVYAQLSATGYPRLKSFFDVSYPIATDASDNTYWLETPSGSISYFKWERYEDGPTLIAYSFEEFVHGFEVDQAAQQRLKDFLVMVEGKLGDGEGSKD